MGAPKPGTGAAGAEHRGQLMSRCSAVAFVLAALLVALPARAQASSPTGGTTYTSKSSPPGGTAAQAQASPEAPVPTATTTTPASPTTPAATVGPDGLALAPAGAPAQVSALIAAANQIATLPYKYGGGHRDFVDTAYDCSGSVSYALHGAQLLDATLDSTGLTHWGRAGTGRWVTVYANKTHTYLVVAGLRFDTSGQKDAGTRWQAAPRSSRGFKVRHPAGL
jgi:cell wall-associated NlpC family hydrolase